MSQSAIRQQANTASALYLEMRGYTILEQNWSRSKRTIDLIAQKKGMVYLVSVIYNASDSSSHQVNVLTSSKLKQLVLAAEAWQIESKWFGKYQISSIELGDPNYSILSFIENVL